MRGGEEHGSMVQSARQTWSHCRGTPRGGSGGGISLSAPSGRGAKTRVTAGGGVSHDSSEGWREPFTFWQAYIPEVLGRFNGRASILSLRGGRDGGVPASGEKRTYAHAVYH